MFPLGDYIPTLRTPVVTYALILLMGATWLFVQQAGLDAQVFAASICEFGLIPGELTHSASVGTNVPLGEGVTCVVADRGWLDALTPLTSMFLHGGWLHIIGNAWFLRIFGDNVEDGMGRGRFLVFYLLCGLVAAAAQVAIDPSSTVPVVGASGAISGSWAHISCSTPRANKDTLHHHRLRSCDPRAGLGAAGQAVRQRAVHRGPASFGVMVPRPILGAPRSKDTISF